MSVNLKSSAKSTLWTNYDEKTAEGASGSFQRAPQIISEGERTYGYIENQKAFSCHT